MTIDLFFEKWGPGHSGQWAGFRSDLTELIESGEWTAPEASRECETKPGPIAAHHGSLCPKCGDGEKLIAEPTVKMRFTAEGVEHVPGTANYNSNTPITCGGCGFYAVSCAFSAAYEDKQDRLGLGARSRTSEADGA